MRLNEVEMTKAKTEQPEPDYEQWFLGLTEKQFIDISEQYIQDKLKIKLPKLDSYDDALNYFKTISPSKIKLLMKTGQNTLSVQEYAALRTWADILSTPHRINKIHKSGLTSSGTQKTIVETARGNDILATLEAIRDKIAERIDGGSDDMARLTQQLRDITHQIADERRKLGPSKDTELGKLIGEYKNKKRTTGKGARAVSFKSRIMIDDVEQ